MITGLTAIALAVSPISSVQDSAPDSSRILGGVWEGRVDVGGQSLRLVLRVDASGDTPRAVLDSPDQGANGFPVEGLDLRSGMLRFAAPTVGARYEGRMSEDGRSITGVLTQGGALPLVLTKTAETASVAGPERPQHPEPPYPYTVEEVAFDTPTPGVRLAGTLTRPQGEGPFPAVLLVSGSGQQDRDETIFGHKPFLVIADALTRRGIAVLRVDDRGVGGSTGDPSGATTADFAVDARGALAWLTARDDIDTARTGVIGHSEGGVIAPLIAQSSPGVAFIGLIAGPAVDGAALLTSQSMRLQQAAGLDAQTVASNTERQRQIMAALAANADDADAAATAVRQASEGLPEASRQQAEQMARRPWTRWFAAHDPGPSLQTFPGPVLALYGGKDVQVDAEQSRQALARLRPDAEIEVYADLNHLMQTAETGLPAEYATIEETFDPVALERLVSWVVEVTGAD